MKKNLSLILTLLILIVVLSAVGFAQQSQLPGANWRLVESAGQVVTDSKASLIFELGLEKFTGNGGCNNIFGKIAVNGQKISFSSIGSTRMFCKLPSTAIPESIFLRSLGNTASYSISNGDLSLIAENGDVLLKFHRFGHAPGSSAGSKDVSKIIVKPIVPIAFVGKLAPSDWVLEYVAGVDTSSPITGASLHFQDSAGVFGGNTGCNGIYGKFIQHANDLKFVGVGTSARACLETEKNNIERGMLDGLYKARRFEVSGLKLRIFGDDGLLLTFRRKAILTPHQ